MRFPAALLVAAALFLPFGERTHAGAFPGLNGAIAFASARDANMEIYVASPDGSGVARLTRDPLSTDIDPSWSPDGRRIAFTSNRVAGGSDDIYVMAADGSGQTRLTTDPASDVNATWSPGGRNIAFSSTRDGDSEIFVMNEDGSGQAQLTRNDGAPDAVPAWSPDGARIAFTSARDGNWEIYVMNVDGSGQTRLTSSPGSDTSPSWSPDGRRIAFASDRDGNYEIYVMNADGSAQTRLTRNLERDLDPAWAPDGTRIAFTSDRDANLEIYTTAADGSAPVRVTASPGDDTTADWQALPLLPRVVDEASFLGTWRVSRYLGRLVVEGRAPGPARVSIALRRGQQVFVRTTLALQAGAFRQTFPLGPDVLPGLYALVVTPLPAPTEVAAQELRLRLTAPPEGVVRAAWASATVGGPPMQRIPASNSIVFAHFRFAAVPRSGLRIVATWYRNGKRAGAPVPRRRSALVITWARVEGAPLPPGSYSCVLRAGSSVVARVTFRVS